MIERMAAPVRTPREDWVAAALAALASGGPAAVRVESLAQSLGVSKGGFYWHFKDRAALLEDVLAAWEERMVDEVIAQVDGAQVDGSQVDARTRLRRLFDLAATRADFLGVELAVRDWARREPDVAARLRRVDDRRVAYLRSLFSEISDDEEDVEGRCLLAMSLFVGSPLVAAWPARRRRRDVMAAATEHLLR
jgi:AcrR family transcriptional regulator